MIESVNQHRLLLANQVRIWLAVAAIGLAGFGISGFSQHQTQQNARAKIAAAHMREHFWRAIAGEESTDNPSVANVLAADLRQSLGPANSEARGLPPAIRTFTGNTNSYGGISSDLGMRPFDDQGRGCDECGPLTSEVKTNLLLIKQGQVGRVIVRDIPPDPQGYSFSVFGLPLWLWVSVGFVLAGPPILLAAHRLTLGGDNPYNFKRLGDMDWSLDGECDGVKRSIMALSPAWFLINRPLYRRRFKESYSSEALSAKRGVAEKIKQIRQYARRVTESDVRTRLEDICDRSEKFLDRVEDAVPTRLLSTASGLNDYLDILRQVSDRYVHVQNHLQDFDEPYELMSRAAVAMDDMNEMLKKSARSLEAGEDMQFEVAVKQLQAARYANI